MHLYLPLPLVRTNYQTSHDRSLGPFGFTASFSSSRRQVASSYSDKAVSNVLRLILPLVSFPPRRYSQLLFLFTSWLAALRTVHHPFIPQRRRVWLQTYEGNNLIPLVGEKTNNHHYLQVLFFSLSSMFLDIVYKLLEQLESLLAEDLKRRGAKFTCVLPSLCRKASRNQGKEYSIPQERKKWNRCVSIRMLLLTNIKECILDVGAKNSWAEPL